MSDYVGGTVAAISIVAATVAYVVTGAVPDVLGAVVLAAVGGVFGAVIPRGKGRE